MNDELDTKNLSELREIAKKRGFKGHSVLSKENLKLLLQGKRILKRLKRNQVNAETQTDFLYCEACFVKNRAFCMLNKNPFCNKCRSYHKRETEYVNDVEIDSCTGEVVGFAVDL